MKTRMNRISAVVSICVASLVKDAAALRAFQYCRAARRDEENGYPLTAAMEWHKAAELFAPVVTSLADRCWQEWERIVKMPRSLAGAIAIGATPVVQLVPRSSSRVSQKLAA